MGSVLIQYDSKKITIQSTTKPGMWLLSFEPVIYFIILFSFMLFVLYKSDSSLLQIL